LNDRIVRNGLIIIYREVSSILVIFLTRTNLQK